MKLLKSKLSNLLDEKIIKDFEDIVLRKPLFNFLLNGAITNDNPKKNKSKENKVDLYSLLFSFISNIFKTIEDIKSLDEICCEKGLTFLFNCINRLYEGIKVITDNFEWIRFERKNNLLFFNNLQSFWKQIVINHNGDWLPEMDKFLINDDSNFAYYRALLFHPFSTSKHPYYPNEDIEDYFKNYRFTQNALKIFTNNTLSGSFLEMQQINKNKYPIYIQIYLIDTLNSNASGNTIKKVDYHSYFLCLDLNDLIKYLKEKYESITLATKILTDKNNELIQKTNFKLTWSNNDRQLLVQIIDLLDKNFLDSIDFKRLLDQYDLFLNNKLVSDNNEILKEYFEEIFITIRKNINYLENYKYQEEFNFFEFINSLSYSKPILSKYSYEIEKIFSYLYGERNGKMPSSDDSFATDIEWGLHQALIFYKNFAKKYINMKILDENLSFLEIQLLFLAAMWKYNNEKCKTHMI